MTVTSTKSSMMSSTSNEKMVHRHKHVSDDDIAEDSPIAQTINLLLEYAIRSSASDIHIEPREEYVQVRYRIDGV